MYQNVLVNETFSKLLDLVCQMRPELDVIYGGVEGCITKIPKQHPNPMKVIQVSYWIWVHSSTVRGTHAPSTGKDGG